MAQTITTGYHNTGSLQWVAPIQLIEMQDMPTKMDTESPCLLCSPEDANQQHSTERQRSKSDV